MTKIEIWWEGPFTKEQISTRNNELKDFGLYQVYGLHEIFGPNSLLYIGQARERPFGTRILEHKGEWVLEWKYRELQFFIGRFGGLNKIEYQEWINQITNAERLLIYFCKPPYNASGLKNIGELRETETIVLNFGDRHKLPMEVSTFWIDSKWWGDDWKEYNSEKQ